MGRFHFSLRSVFWYIVLGLLLLGNIAFSFFLPPFQVIDEPGHFIRAYGITEGKLRCSSHNGEYGLWSPKGIGDAHLTMRSGYLARRPELPLTPYTESLSPSSDYLFLPNVYCEAPPTAYLPQALGISIAKLFGTDTFGMLVAARIVNGIVGSLFILLAVFLIPFAKPLTLLLGTLPMMLHQVFSASPDSMLFSGLLFLIAYSFYLARKEHLSPRHYITYALVSLLLINVKLGYQFFALLLLFFRPRQWDKCWKYVAFILLTLVGHLLYFSLIRWIFTLNASEVIGIDRAANMSFIIEQPLSFALLFWNTLQHQGWLLFQEVLGTVGWQDRLLSFMQYISILGGIFLSLGHTYQDTQTPTRIERFSLFGIVLLVSATIGAALFVLSTSSDSLIIRGLQGKYFLPVLFALLLACSSLRCSPRWIYGVVFMSICFNAFWFLSAVQQRYYYPEEYVNQPISLSAPITRLHSLKYSSESIPEDRILRLSFETAYGLPVVPYVFHISDRTCNRTLVQQNIRPELLMSYPYMELPIPESLSDGFCIRGYPIRSLGDSTPLQLKGYWHEETFHPFLR